MIYLLIILVIDTGGVAIGNPYYSQGFPSEALCIAASEQISANNHAPGSYRPTGVIRYKAFCVGKEMPLKGALR